MLKSLLKKTNLIKFIGLIIIRILYTSLVFNQLNGQLYAKDVSYGIAFNFISEIWAMCVFLVLTFFYTIVRILNTFIQYLTDILFIIYFIPINSAFSLNNTSLGFFLCSTFFCIILFCLIYLFGEFLFNKPKCKIKDISLLVDNWYIRVFCFLICVFLIAHKLMYNGLNFSLSIDATTVYAQRSAYHDYTQSISGTLYAYLLSIVKNLSLMVIPYYFLISLINKKIVGIVASIMAVVSMYAISFEKANLLYFGIALILFVCYKLKLTNHINILLIIGVIAAILFCFVETLIKGESSLFIVIIRRMMYLPAWISNMYYDFFSQNPKVLWSQDVFLLKKFLTPVYDESILNIINNTYFKGAVPSPNTGLFAESYMHFGFSGTFIYTIIISVIVAVSGKIYNSKHSIIVILMAVQLAFSLINVPLTWTETVLSYFLFTFIIAVLSVLKTIKFKSKVLNIF